jgi:hypothetical protein
MRSYEEIKADALPERTFSNGSEFDIWADRWCYECVHDDANQEKYCPILSVAMLGEGRPREWTTRKHEWTIGDSSGSFDVINTCTEFERRPDNGGGDDEDPGPDPGPPPVHEGQLDLIDAYLDAAIGELSTAPAMAERPA